MTAYLLDTNIISKFAPGRPPSSTAARAWFHEQGEADALFLSAITIAEAEKGVRSLYRRGGAGSSERSDCQPGWMP